MNIIDAVFILYVFNYTNIVRQSWRMRQIEINLVNCKLNVTNGWLSTLDNYGKLTLRW